MQPSPQGQCPQYGHQNSYTIPACLSCGARLPWADAITPTAPMLTAPLTPGRTFGATNRIVYGLLVFLVVGAAFRLATKSPDVSPIPNTSIAVSPTADSAPSSRSSRKDFPGSPLLSDAENDYVRVVGQTLDTLRAAEKAIMAAKNTTVNPNGIQQEIERGRFALAQAKASYTTTAVPPRFAKTDTLVREALSEEKQAFSYWAVGSATHDTQTAAKATSHYVYAADLVHMALNEIKSIAVPASRQ